MVYNRNSTTFLLCHHISLRITALKEDLGQQEHGTGEGDTYNDVMKDFSQRLQRRNDPPPPGAASTSMTNPTTDP